MSMPSAPVPFQNIMAANRGEIAVRIFRACTELGIPTTAIYSWEDRLSIHRYKADRAYQVGEEGAPVAAYLDQEEILALARQKGVDAIHPGYGFLSENATFARRCIEAGITWIGPPPEVMEKVGDKVRARQVAQAAGVPVVPGTPGAVEELEQARAFGQAHGYPLLFKAAHGGGGRGMRVVEREEDLAEALRAARDEAKAAFGAPEVFLERYLERPRHIEVQVLGDGHGNIVHLFERDCSIQRRHQKLVEIAPAPALDDEVRQKLHDYSLRIARAVGYSSAGTFEFLVEEGDDGATQIYFIEVNTRIQVEHTVTEMVTGHDLIKAMIRIAQGHRLGSPEIGIASQDALSLHGQAIQARITTEDPENHFAPDSGKIITYRSAAGFGIRLDAGVGGSGSVVVPHYDSLLVKVSAWGRDLADAAVRLDRSLAEFRIRGVKTNIPFLQNVIGHPLFLQGRTHTKFVDQTPELFVYPPRKNRGNKALRAIGDIIVNGPPGAGTKLTRPSPLIEPRAPKPPHGGPPPVSPACAAFKAHGAQGLSQWLSAQDRVQITDTTFRDAHQSLLATRVRTGDLLAIAPTTAHLLPGLFSYEMWGGATFDVCMRFLQEDPWERLSRLREAIPGSLFQMLLRGANAVGYKNYPDNVVRRFIQESAKGGIDIFRIFDALNYVPNMELAMEEVNAQGKIVEASICYTGDVLAPGEDKYTLAYYVELAEQLAARGAHILNIKDMAGLLKPYSARALIRALKDAVDLPIHLHTHDTSGNGVAMYLMAVEAGVDAIDCALSSMAGLTSQPSLNAVVTALEQSERCPDLDTDHLQTLSDYWELLREIYYPFESGLKSSTTDVYYHEIPGGQYSNLRPRAVQLGLGDRWGTIKDTYHEVNAELGKIIKVTPTSKVVADFAMFLVQGGMTIAQVYQKHEQGEDLDFPQSVKDFFGGLLGQPHGGFPERLQRIVLRGKTPLTGRAGEQLEAYDWDLAKGELEGELGREATVQEQISYALYPAVFLEFATRTAQHGQYRALDTVTFLYGLELGEERFIEIEEGKRLVVKLTAMGAPDAQGMRLLYFELNGQPRQISVRDQSVEFVSRARAKADRGEPGQVGAAMPGKVLQVLVRQGDEVQKGDVLAVTEAMKMETSITAPMAGTVERLEVAKGDQVQPGDLVVLLS